MVPRFKAPNARLRLVPALLLLSVGLAACPADPERVVRVDLRTDYVPAVEFDVVRLEVGDGDLAFRADHLVRASADFVRGERVDETSVQPGPIPLTVTLYRSGVPVATRRVSIVVEGSITVVTMVITRSCEGVECPNDNPLFDSCLGGRCVDPRCTVETPEFCPEALCTTADDCESVPCAEPRCEDDVCFSLPDDSRCADGERCDGILGCTPIDTVRDAGIDAAPLDVGAPTDAGVDGMPDVGVDAFDAGTDAGPSSACPLPDPNTVFLHDFATITDVITGINGIHDGSRLIASDSPCGGNMLEIPPAGVNLFRISDRASFQLSEGSIDFWFKGPAVTGYAPILTRDASGSVLPGHLGVYYTEMGEIIVRNQEPGQTDGGACTGVGTVPPDTWVRVGIQFGPDRVNVYIDGVLRSRPGTYDFEVDLQMDCERPVTVGIMGNSNPFAVGANTGNSAEGSHLPLLEVYGGLQVDHLRLSSVRRNYESEIYP